MPRIAVASSLRLVVSGVSSDAHTWNLVYLQALLEEWGARVVNLGACVPDREVMDACRRLRPDLLVLGTVNGHGHLDGRRLIRRIRADRALAAMPAVIGGRLDTLGSAGEDVGTPLLDAGFDAVFDAEQGVEEFIGFLTALAAQVRSEHVQAEPVRSAADRAEAA